MESGPKKGTNCIPNIPRGFEIILYNQFNSLVFSLKLITHFKSNQIWIE